MARVCKACGKAFSSEFFLSKHMDRRHPDLVQKQEQEKGQEPEAQDQEKGMEEEKKDPEKAAPLSPTEGGGDAGGENTGSTPPVTTQENRAEAAAGAGIGGDEKDKKEKERAAEVAEGARRLGELVREREHARFRSEVVALRKEIEDLKVRGRRWWFRCVLCCGADRCWAMWAALVVFV